MPNARRNAQIDELIPNPSLFRENTIDCNANIISKRKRDKKPVTTVYRDKKERLPKCEVVQPFLVTEGYLMATPCPTKIGQEMHCNLCGTEIEHREIDGKVITKYALVFQSRPESQSKNLFTHEKCARQTYPGIRLPWIEQR